MEDEGEIEEEMEKEVIEEERQDELEDVQIAEEGEPEREEGQLEEGQIEGEVQQLEGKMAEEEGQLIEEEEGKLQEIQAVEERKEETKSLNLDKDIQLETVKDEENISTGKKLCSHSVHSCILYLHIPVYPCISLYILVYPCILYLCTLFLLFYYFYDVGKHSPPIKEDSDNEDIPVISSPIRLTPEPEEPPRRKVTRASRRDLISRGNRPGHNGNNEVRLSVKERLYLSKEDIGTWTHPLNGQQLLGRA